MARTAATLALIAATFVSAQADRIATLREKAEKGNTYAQVQLGYLFETGEGVPQDHAEARRLYRLAAERGNSTAQFYLGVIYADEEPVDPEEAVRWFRKSAEQDDPDAQYRLGAMIANGQGTTKDPSDALRWYGKAASKHNPDALYALGLMYRDGEGVPQNFVSAHMWLNLAATYSEGDEKKERATAREQLAAKMTAQQVAEAQRLAKEWEPRVSIPGPAPPVAPAGVLLRSDGGVFVVPVSINNKITLDFILDSGAADVSIPSDVVSTLIRTGTITAEDFIGSSNYRLADGSSAPSEMFRIRSLRVGDRTLQNIVGSINSASGSLLLGQSFLSRFESWTIDNKRHVLLLK